MVKYQFGKNWNWVDEISNAEEINNQHLDIVYRLDAQPCTFGKCKVNCNTNPYCLNGLGEKKLANLLQKQSAVNVERNEYLRNKEDYAGLVNLGATCYINTYLQVWFNNPIFRESILNIDFDNPFSDETDMTNTKDSSKEKSSEDEEKIPSFKIVSSKCIAFNLQLIFYLLKESVRKSIDPNFFIKALGLDENMQQDAQEFSQLFLTILQSKLPKNNSGNDIIKYLFEGEYSYITECDSCKRQSIRSSSFLELSLNIQNSNTIFECINDLLKDEVMDGDNQYYCDDCDCKRNAKRITQLSKLPPVLNLQLLRFVYDRTSGMKKKLATKIKFPEILDLSEFKAVKRDNNSSESAPVYYLGAILMHIGKSAYSGHYMAQIKNFETNEWFTFNDESIFKIKKKQQLGRTEDEIEKLKTGKQQQQQQQQQLQQLNEANESDTATSQEGPSTSGSAGASNDQLKNLKTFSTSNAYLLVYYRKDLINSENFLNASEKTNKENTTRALVLDDNESLEKWFNNLKDSKTDQRENKNIERTVIQSIYSTLWCNENNRDKPLHFINTEFIRKLLTEQTNYLSSTEIASMQKYLCAHKRLNPFAVNKFKVITDEGLQLILRNYSYFTLNDIGAFETQNNETTRCYECIKNIFSYLKLKERLKDDTKLLRVLLKSDETVISDNYVFDSEMENQRRNGESNYVNGNTDDVIVLDSVNNDTQANSKLSSNFTNGNTSKRYWIGKESLRLWTSLALKKYESQLPMVKFNDIEVIDLTNGHNTPVTTTDTPAATTNETKSEAQDAIENLNDKLHNSQISTTQQVSTNEKADNDGEVNSVADVTFPFNGDIVCEHGNLSPTQNKRLVSSDINNFFLTYFPTMSQFLADSPECKFCLSINAEYNIKKNEVKSQKDVLTDLYQNRSRPMLIDYPNESMLYVVTLDFVKEWRSMIKNSKFKDIEINNSMLLCQHKKLPFNDKNFDSSLGYLVTVDEWKFLSNHYKFDNEITIQKIDPETIIFEPDVCEMCYQQNELSKLLYEDKKIFIRNRDDDLVDVDVNKDNCEIVGNVSTSKKLKLSDNNDEFNYKEANGGTLSPVFTQKSQNNGNLRRSKRARKCKGDMELIVSSYNTVKQVKIQIAAQTNKLISEQHLYFNSVELDNDKTLIDYKINPGDVLKLKLDQGTNDDFESTNYELAHTPEIGFKGTNLHGY